MAQTKLPSSCPSLTPAAPHLSCTHTACCWHDDKPVELLGDVYLVQWCAQAQSTQCTVHASGLASSEDRCFIDHQVMGNPGGSLEQATECCLHTPCRKCISELHAKPGSVGHTFIKPFRASPNRPSPPTCQTHAGVLIQPQDFRVRGGHKPHEFALSPQNTSKHAEMQYRRS